MGLLYWALFGLVAGAIAKWIMPGDDGDSWFKTMLLGIGGAWVGGFLGDCTAGGFTWLACGEPPGRSINPNLLLNFSSRC